MATRGIFLIADDEKVCCNCKHFWQHYIYDKNFLGDYTYIACYAGHCVKPRVKNRKPKYKACEHFEWKNGDGNV